MLFISDLSTGIACAHNNLPYVFALNDVFAIGELPNKFFPGLAAVENTCIVMAQCRKIGFTHINRDKSFLVIIFNVDIPLMIWRTNIKC